MLIKEGNMPEAHKTTAILRMMTSWDPEIRKMAPTFLNHADSGTLNIDSLVNRSGDVSRGSEVFSTYCSSCHVVGSSGTEFGPGLSDIGNKLSKQFLYSSILYPSAGINFGYEGYAVKTADGITYSGYILSRTEDELTLKMMGGQQKTIPISDIESLEAMDTSLMTEGLHKVMTEDELVDLVTYLQTLKLEEQAL